MSNTWARITSNRNKKELDKLEADNVNLASNFMIKRRINVLDVSKMSEGYSLKTWSTSTTNCLEGTHIVASAPAVVTEVIDIRPYRGKKIKLLKANMANASGTIAFYSINGEYHSHKSSINEIDIPNDTAAFMVGSFIMGSDYPIMIAVVDENYTGVYVPFDTFVDVPSLDKYTAVEKIRIRPIKSMEDWNNLGMGLFIHWGVYAALVGKYNGVNVIGETVNFDSGTGGAGAEWILRSARIPKDTYKAYQSQFTSTNWNADSIAKMAYKAGMKYIVLTAKHHEGFCLFKSQNAEWNISSTSARTTVIDELKAACKKYGLKFGLYFSQNYDWTAVGGFGQNFVSADNTTDPYTTAQHNAYVEKTKLLINEMLDKYQPDMLWYDIPGTDSYMTPLKLNELETYPHIIVNDRLSSSNKGDYRTGEGNYYQKMDSKYAENCFTLNNTWGYGETNDTEAKMVTIGDLLKTRILESVGRGQNVLLNIGPKKDGSVPALQSALLGNLATFVQKYGDFSNCRSVNTLCQPLWGRMVRQGRTLRCFVYAGTSIQIHGIYTSFIDKVRVYGAADEYATANYSVVSDTILEVSNLVYDTNNGNIAVVDITFKNDIVSEDVNYISNNEITALAFNFHGTTLRLQGFSDVINMGSWTKSEDTIDTVFVFTGTTGAYKLKLNYTSRQTATAYTVTATVNNLTTNATATNATITDTSVNDTSTGTITFTNGQKYKLTLQKTGGFVNFKGIQLVT